ncbi:hypothetical protein [Rhodococcus sp. NPDC047139]|uniref:hypothetical protein n=1 Tax=Rhodococcus sp. NPDC047139 TaxID=3155141 RepID=UPI0033CF012F
MSTWTVYSDTNLDRWLNHRGRLDWVADGETTAALADPDMAFPLTPTGPIHQGIRTEAGLFAAALHVIPAARWVGEVPRHPLPPARPGLIY